MMNDVEQKRIKLLLDSLDAETRLAAALRAQGSGVDTVWQRLHVLHRLAKEVEHVLVHEKSLEALQRLDEYLRCMPQGFPESRVEPSLGPPEAQVILRAADAGLDGTVARYREMAVWSTMEPEAAVAFNATWSEAISAASLVRSVACCAHFVKRDGRIPGWLVLQTYGMWRSCMMCGGRDAVDSLPAIFAKAKDLLEQLNAVGGEAGREA